MGSIDVAKVITAAAASTLGVLSLIILAVSFVGFNFFKRSGDGVKIGVWAVMLLAAVGFAFAVVRQGEEQAKTGRQPRVEPTSGTATEPRFQPTAGKSPAAGRSPTSLAEAEEPEPGDVAISGRWHDDVGFFYDIAASGTTFAFQQSAGGINTGRWGQGTIIGRKMDYSFVDNRTMDRGTCSAMLSRDGQRIDGSCTNGAGRWGLAVKR